MGPARTFALMSLLAVVASAAEGMALNRSDLTLWEVRDRSDLVFVGTVERMQPRLLPTSMVVTDIAFVDVQVHRAGPGARQADMDRIVLTHGGGAWEDLQVSVSGVPAFEQGRRYLVFSRDDGRTYANPVVGGLVLEVVRDASGRDRLRTLGGRPLLRLEAGRLHTGTAVRGTEGGVGTMAAPAAADPRDGAATGAPQTLEGPGMELAAFLRELDRGGAAYEAALRFGSGGRYLTRDGERVVDVALPALEGAPSRPSDRVARALAQADTLGGTLGACGYHNLNLVMEQVPTGWWSWPINNDSMWMWNQLMDVYQYTPDDGSFGDNGQNEFCGWVDDATLNSVYGLTWNGGISMTISWTIVGFPCGVITQSDVLWNPAYNWTDDFNVSLGNSNVILLHPVDMHELGHTWGAQRGGSGWGYPETLDYDLLSVMHAYYWDVVEDGRGIHASDAYLIRRQYDNQTSILTFDDMGIESYTASNGLINATTDKGTYVPGEAITIRDLTVENMGYQNPAQDVRVRLFLSLDRNITPADHQLGSYWYWTTFDAETYWTGDISTTIPTTVPPNDYYVGAMVTINGFQFDAFIPNSKTSLYRQITVNPAPMVADFSATPLVGGPAPLTVDFTDLSSPAPTAWMWDFGDGTTDTVQNPSHVYADPGIYTVTLTASDPYTSDTETKLDYILVRATEEIVTGSGAGPSNPTEVKTWDHASPPGMVDRWLAYGAPQYGVNVDSQDIIGGGVFEILTGPGPGYVYGPQVRGFFPVGTAIQKVNFYAYGTLRYGVEPGGGDIEGDGHHEILTSPGPGAVFGPHIRGWNYDGIGLSAVMKVNFFAYGTLKFGARSAGGDVDADGFGEIVTGAGAGPVFNPHVRAFNYDGSMVASTPVNLFAFGSGRYGAAVAAGDTDGDGRDTIIAAHGPDITTDTEVKGFDWSSGVTNVWAVTAFSGSLGGAEPSAGDLDADGVDALVVARGWGDASPADVVGYDISGGSGMAIPGVSFSAYTTSYGAKVAVGDTGLTP